MCNTDYNFVHLSTSRMSSEGLLRTACYGGVPSSTGLYSESSTACSSSLVFDICLVTQHCRIMARLDFLNE